MFMLTSNLKQPIKMYSENTSYPSHSSQLLQARPALLLDKEADQWRNLMSMMTKPDIIFNLCEFQRVGSQPIDDLDTSIIRYSSLP